LGSKYDPDMVLALEGMDIEEEIPEDKGFIETFGVDGAPSPAE